MGTATNQVIHFHVTHVGQAGNSAKMEKAGLFKLLEKVETLGEKARPITTDRHQGVAKSREEKDWVKAIISHFWWCCSSCNGNYEDLKGRWMSLMFHISNKHKWARYNHFKKYAHPKLTRQQIKKKKWIKQGTPAFTAVEKIVKKKKTLTNLQRCTEFRHSGNLEVYHAVYLKFCTKRLHFSFEGMIARTELAILHFNSSVTELYATNRLGKQINKQQYSKITSTWVIKKVKKPSDRTSL